MAQQKSNKQATTKRSAPFIQYLKQHRQEHVILIAFYIIAACILRYCYPYTEIFSDTGGYMNWSDLNPVKPYDFGGPRPMGYTNFITFLKGISSSTFIIFFAQYILHCVASYFLYFSTTYIFNITSSKLRYLLLACTLLYIPGIAAANMVMSDSLFTSLTIIIVTLSMWLSYKPNIYWLLAITVFIFWAVTIRYIGLIYPAICIPVLFISMKQKLQAAAFSGLLLILLWSYAQYIINGTDREMGIAVFSGFSNWQKANNALHVVPHLDKSKPLVNGLEDDFQIAADSLVRLTYQTNSDIYADDNEVTYDHIWHKRSSLKVIHRYYGAINNDDTYYPSWNKVSVELGDYANKLITAHFGLFFRYYLLNNTVRTIHPPEEIFETGTDTLTAAKASRSWFQLGKQNYMPPRQDVLRPFLKNASVAFTIYWILFACCLVYSIFLLTTRRLQLSDNKTRTIIVIIWFILAYTAANIYAAPVNLRFLLPLRPFILALTFILFHIHTQLKGNKQETLT